MTYYFYNKGIFNKKTGKSRLPAGIQLIVTLLNPIGGTVYLTIYLYDRQNVQGIIIQTVKVGDTDYIPAGGMICRGLKTEAGAVN